MRWLCAVAVVSVGSTAFVPACSLEPREYPDEPPISFECESHADCDDGEACSKEYCDEHGLCVRSNDDDYVPDDDNECTDDRCVERAPFWLPRTGQTCGGHNGAALCDADGECVGCEAIFSEADCGSEKWCDVDRCVFKREHGEPCIMGLSCISGFCSDGVCCDAKCDGLCRSCLTGSTGWQNGNCHAIEPGTDPDGECYPGVGCGVGGMCAKAFNGEPCAGPAECGSGHCEDGVCCDQMCSGPCRSCALPSSLGVCMDLAPAETPPGACPGNTTCSGAGTCDLWELGSACSISPECISGNCIDNRCCESACSELCMACNLAIPGHCANIPAGQDPGSECAGSLSCNGAGACQ